MAEAKAKVQKENEKEKTDESGAAAPATEMASTPAQRSSTGVSAGTSQDPSRPSSLYPEGDFRNGPRESVLDIKSDVMVSYLHQQQLEKMWASGAPGEGVILKKAKGIFTCFPSQMEEDPSGIYEAVKAMNVKVSAGSEIHMAAANLFGIVCYDSYHSSDPDFSCPPGFGICSTFKRSSSPGPTNRRVLAQMSETSLWCLHPRSTDSIGLGRPS